MRLINPLSIAISLWSHRDLILQLSKREISSRYKGSILGGVWALINPLMMLTVYTFVFGVIFKSKWSAASTQSYVSQHGTIEFAIILFAGLIVFNVFAECISRAPQLILNQPSYVKRVVFPLEVLPAVSLLNSLFHTLVSLIVLLVGSLITYNTISPTILLFPLVLLPLIFSTLGLTWFLSSLGVYVRDIVNIVSIIINMTMFLSPIFYPLNAVPEKLRLILKMNPLTYVIEDARLTLLWGEMPRWNLLSLYTFGSLIIAWLGFVWFQKTRKGFADVL